VISPEAGASILWRDAAKAQDAANNMKITATDLMSLGIIDGIIPEPAGGAHRHHEEVMNSTSKALTQFLTDFPGNRGRLEIREHRRDKFLAIGTNLS
jgi:acetyl-CoA carboxylase carboxyl transferase subunit alpha